jgi:Flp pilus assembly protein TadG
VGLLGLAALAIDVGMLWTTRRQMQTAADAAAVAASRAMAEGTSVSTAANAVATLDGFTDGTNGVTVTVNNPPLSGTYAGNSSYVETIVQQAAPTYFLQVLGYNTVNVRARAVGGGINIRSCLYALDPSGAGAFSLSGSGSITSGCGIMVDSSSSSALTTTGSGSITASSVGVVGNYSGGGSGSITPTPITGIAQGGDPLANLVAPAVGSCMQTNYHISGSSGATLSAGVYCNGISITGSSTVTFDAGTYVLLGGGLSVSGSGSLSGTGVIFYNTCNSTYSYGSINLPGSSTVNFSAPTSGLLAGILFFQDPTVPVGSTASKITGSSSSTFDGAVYFPTTAVAYSGSSSSSGYTILVAYDLALTGSGTLSLGNNYSSLANGSPIRSHALFE